MRDDYTPEETAYWNGRVDEKKKWEDKIKAKIEEVKDGTYDAKIVLQLFLKDLEVEDD